MYCSLRASRKAPGGTRRQCPRVSGSSTRSIANLKLNRRGGGEGREELGITLDATAKETEGIFRRRKNEKGKDPRRGRKVSGI